MEKDLLRPQLFMFGENIRVVKHHCEPHCMRCGETIKNKANIYFCTVSKNVYCNKCMHSRVHWNCPNPQLQESHEDLFCTLEVKA